MQDELEDHQEYYRSLNYECWCNPLYTIKAKDEMKNSETQIKKIASARADYLSESDESTRITRKKKSRTGILSSNKGPHKKVYNRHGTQRYCMIWKKAGMPDKKYISHSANECTGICTNRIIMYGMGVSVVSGSDTVKQYKKS